MTSTPWWRNASVLQIYVRSFSDSDGTGTGDLAGIRHKLPYIASLGVEAIWLNPCYPSPQIDHGYDVADYFSIEPDYGDLAEFDRLVADGRQHGIKILMDVVPNHCSWEHAWFKAAVAAGPGSPERKRFYFLPGKGSDGSLPPNNWQAIFGGSAWTRVTEPDGSLGEWYLGVFTPAQPDLNWNNPEVVTYFDEMLCFWFDRGVEGFRADAVTVLAKAEGFPDLSDEELEAVRLDPFRANPLFTWLPEGHNAWRHWRQTINRYNDEHPGRDVYIVAEAYTPGRPDLMLEYVNPDEFHQAFAFDLMLAPWRPNMMRSIIGDTVRVLADEGLVPAWTLNNHDAQRSVTRFGRNDVVDRVGLANGAISNTRVPVDFAVGVRRARAAFMLEAALPGCLYLYAGEELALPEVLELPDSARQDPVFHYTGGAQYGRDGCRVPLPWTRSPAGSYGFSPASATKKAWLPQPDGWGDHSVEVQEADPESMLSLYRAAGQYRKSSSDLRSDDFAWVDAMDDDLLVFLRGDVLVVLNATNAARSIPAHAVGARTVVMSSVFGHFDPLTIPSDATIWLA